MQVLFEFVFFFQEVLCQSLKNRLHLPGPLANGVVACCGPPMWRFIWCHAVPAVAFFVPLDSSSIQVPWDHWGHGSHLGASWKIWKNVPSLKLTVRTWKYTPGKGDSYWKPSFLRCHVSFREGIHLKNSRSGKPFAFSGHHHATKIPFPKIPEELMIGESSHES